MALSASKRVEQGPLGLICIFSPSSVRHEAASSPSRVGLRTSVGQIPELGLGGLSPRAPLGLVGVGRVSCVTLSVVSATKGVELMTLASMARVTHLVSSLMGMLEWNPGPSLVIGSA